MNRKEGFLNASMFQLVKQVNTLLLCIKENLNFVGNNMKEMEMSHTMNVELVSRAFFKETVTP